ncbi:hypothetical protein D3C75_1021850 [compost metagenome]
MGSVPSVRPMLFFRALVSEIVTPPKSEEPLVMVSCASSRACAVDTPRERWASYSFARADCWAVVSPSPAAARALRAGASSVYFPPFGVVVNSVNRACVKFCPPALMLAKPARCNRLTMSWDSSPSSRL